MLPLPRYLLGLLLIPSLTCTTFPIRVPPAVASQEAAFLDTESGRQGHRLVVNDYAITHQGHHQLNLVIEYETNAPERSLVPEDIRSYIDHFLQEYPNEDDFWEIVNRNLAISLTATYPMIDTLRLTIDVAPCEQFPQQRGSLVEFRGGSLREHWYFSVPLPSLDQTKSASFAHLWVEYDYQPSPDGDPTAYPDYNAVRAYLPVNIEVLNSASALQETAARIQQSFPSLREVTVELKALP